LRSGKLSELADAFVVAETGIVDDDHGPFLAFGNHNMYGTGGDHGFVARTVLRAVTDYAAANKGARPTDASQLAPYLSAPLKASDVKDYWDQMRNIYVDDSNSES